MNSSVFTVPTHPTLNADGTLTALSAAPSRSQAGALLLTLRMPVGLARERLAGRYFLARCGAQTEWERAEHWQFYLRRPLFVVNRQRSSAADSEIWHVSAPASDDPGLQWLAHLAEDAPVNLIGPLGNGVALLPSTRNLLILAEPARAPALLPAVEPVLDRGGHVTLALRSDAAVDPDLLAALPMAVEVRQVGDGAWPALLAETVRWADQIVAVLPAVDFPSLAETIRQRRFRLEPGFALMLVESDLVCGYGACLACVIPTANGGYTRSCVHGPVFDLVELV